MPPPPPPPPPPHKCFSIRRSGGEGWDHHRADNHHTRLRLAPCARVAPFTQLLSFLLPFPLFPHPPFLVALSPFYFRLKGARKDTGYEDVGYQREEEKNRRSWKIVNQKLSGRSPRQCGERVADGRAERRISSTWPLLADSLPRPRRLSGVRKGEGRGTAVWLTP